MRRWFVAAVLITCGLFGITPIPLVRAQTTPGTICILTFVDANKNGIQEAGEPSLAGVSANLKQDGILLSNRVTADQTTSELCFRNLPAGEYAVTFASQFADATTATQFAFTLKPNDQLQATFGAAPRPVAPTMPATPQA